MLFDLEKEKKLALAASEADARNGKVRCNLTPSPSGKTFGETSCSAAPHSSLASSRREKLQHLSRPEGQTTSTKKASAATASVYQESVKPRELDLKRQSSEHAVSKATPAKQIPQTQEPVSRQTISSSPVLDVGPVTALTQQQKSSSQIPRNCNGQYLIRGKENYRPYANLFTAEPKQATASVAVGSIGVGCAIAGAIMIGAATLGIGLIFAGLALSIAGLLYFNSLYTKINNREITDCSVGCCTQEVEYRPNVWALGPTA